MKTLFTIAAIVGVLYLGFRILSPETQASVYTDTRPVGCLPFNLHYQDPIPEPPPIVEEDCNCR